MTGVAAAPRPWAAAPAAWLLARVIVPPHASRTPRTMLLRVERVMTSLLRNGASPQRSRDRASGRCGARQTCGSPSVLHRHAETNETPGEDCGHAVEVGAERVDLPRDRVGV